VLRARLCGRRACEHAGEREVELHVVQEERQVVPGACRTSVDEKVSFGMRVQACCTAGATLVESKRPWSPHNLRSFDKI